MAYKNEKRMLHALEAFARLCKTLYQRQLRTKSCSKEFVATLFQAPSTCSQERRGFDEIYLHYGRLQAGKWTKTTQNKRMMPAEKRANSSAISQVKEGLYLDPKPSPRKTH